MSYDGLPENYVVEIERRGRLRWEATVFLLRAGAAAGPTPLVTVRAVTATSARRRAARFITLRQQLDPAG